MKLPRFSLRTLLGLVALAAIAMGWVVFQLNWIRQRREFAMQHSSSHYVSFMRYYPDAPWSVRLFGESSGYDFESIPPEELDRAIELFPERFSR